MSNRTKYRGLGSIFAGVPKGIRIQLSPYVNQIAKGMKDLAAQIPTPKQDGKK